MSDTLKVLIAGDDENTCRLVRAILQREGTIAVVGMARSGSDLVGLISAQSPDLVLLDLDTPGEQMLAAIQRIKLQGGQTGFVGLVGNGGGGPALLSRVDALLHKNTPMDSFPSALCIIGDRFRRSPKVEAAAHEQETLDRVEEPCRQSEAADEVERAIELTFCKRTVSLALPVAGGEAAIEDVQRMSPIDSALPDRPSSAEGTSLEFLITKLRNLTLRNQELESSLELANRKLAFYEGFDESIQDTMAYSLRVAFDIRYKSEQQANDLLERARRDAALLKEEARKLTAERDALINEQDRLRKLAEEARNQRQLETSRRIGQTSERSQLLSDVQALESRLRSIRADLDSLSAVGLDRSSKHDINRAAAPARDVTNEHQPSLPPSFDSQTSASRTEVKMPLVQENPFEQHPAAFRTPASPAKYERPFTQKDRPEYFEAFQAPASPTVDEKPFTQRDRSEHAEAFQAAATPVRDEKPFAQRDQPEHQADLPAVQSTSEVELVVSPIHSFPKLVELERALQTLREVKSSYVRDFRYGVATLLIKLISSELREELPAKLEALPGWKLAILSCPPHRIEARIEA